MKKVNNKGLLSIRIDSNNEMKVVFKPVNDTVWMDRNDLCQLFGCYMKDIDRCLEEIFGKNLLRLKDTCRYHIIAGGRRVSYDITAVNLTVIITMAFRLETPEAQTLRIWFVAQIAKMRGFDVLFPDTGEKFRLN
ncbi:hypothetical protein [Bacteroides sp. 519]|uniref:hypothetical protein n=1 Tax=Bacteroides sp. 519 TaxID=2302937 RepID=UPI0013CF7223|nr:hypothetical protein [Bacteroides sp. 519]NDV58777.1 hypothetical protein [Bacteroides sp. 519]